MNYDDLDEFLAEDEKKLAEQEAAWEEERARLREERKGTVGKVEVNEETVAWTAESVRKKLTDKIESARKDIDQVEVDKQRDRSDVCYRILIFIGACLIFPVIKWLLPQPQGFTVLYLFYGLGAAFAILWTGRELLNSITVFWVRGRLKPANMSIKGMKVLTYEQEVTVCEERVVKINKYLDEVKELMRRSELRGGLSNVVFERLSSLQFAGAKEKDKFITTFTAMQAFRALFEK